MDFHLLVLTTYMDWLRLLLQINRSHMEQQKNELLPGTLNLMVLNPSAHWGHCMGTASPGGLSRSVAISSNSTRGRFIQLCCISSRWVGSVPNGACRKTTGAPSITRLHGPERSSLPPKKRAGGGRRKS